MVSSDVSSEPRSAKPVSSRITGMASRMVNEIGKADITFERLAEALSIREAPKREDRLVNLNACLSEVCACLPQPDRDLISLDLPESDIRVTGDDGRLRFVLRSIIAHLIRLHNDDSERIRVELSLSDDRVVLDLALQDPDMPSAAPDITAYESQEPDYLLKAMRAAREAASLSLRTIRLIVKKHRGKLETASDGVFEEDGSSVPTRFRLNFPQA